MQLEYKNGVRITPLIHEMSPLEAAIQKYEQMATEHFGSDSEGLSSALEHLELERGRLASMAQYEAQLEKYRQEVFDSDGEVSRKGAKMMREEKHHPTELLEQNMAAEGIPKPSTQHTAHHIVPGKGKLPKITLATRLWLHQFGIRINDSANGVYLVMHDKYTPHWSMPKSSGHLKYHTHLYEEMVRSRVLSRHTMDTIKTELQVIGRILQNTPAEQLQRIFGNESNV